MVNAGEMTRLLRVLNPTDDTDARGSTKPDYVPGGTVWAKIAPIAGEELEVGEVRFGVATHKITTHHTDRISNRSVLEHVRDGRKFEVVGMVNLGELDRFLELRCREAVA